MANYSGIQMVKLVTDHWSLVALTVERVPGAVNIPVGQLRSCLSELPRDRQIYVICRSPSAPTTATRILLQSGLRARNLSGGMLSRAMLGIR